MADEETNTNQSQAAEEAEDEEEEGGGELKRKSRASREDEIMKELKKIKRQNSITHFLLTASVLVTLAWQLSEYSLIFKIRQGFNNPLKTIHGAIKGLFYNQQDPNHQQMQIPQTHMNLPGLKIPDFDFTPSNSSNDDDDDD